MIIQDKVYGEFKITEPVIIDLVNSKAIKRLKGVDQSGYFEPYYPGTKHSRFEHSLGDYILLNKFGASLEEQIAGLIHDVSHSAFSHCIDYVFDDDTQKTHSHQDDIFEEYVLTTDIPDILKKYGYDVERLLDESNFKLQENDLPDICADRIDYSLRGLIMFGEAEKWEIDKILDNLEIVDNNWIFKDFEVAKRYAELFEILNRVYYSAIESAVQFKTVGKYMSHALGMGYATKEDLYQTDQFVLNKVNKNLELDSELNSLWLDMNRGDGYIDSPEGYDEQVFCKSRIIDPLCKHNGTIKRVSDVEKSWAEVIKRESKPKEYFIKFLNK